MAWSNCSTSACRPTRGSRRALQPTSRPKPWRERRRRPPWICGDSAPYWPRLVARSIRISTRSSAARWRRHATTASNRPSRSGTRSSVFSAARTWWTVSRLAVVSPEAAALKPWINPVGHLWPETAVDGEQRVELEAAQLPPLFDELGERSPRPASELEPQFLVRQQAAEDWFDQSL